MAFLLRDLPNEQNFDTFRGMYPTIDPVAISAFVRLLRVGSDLLTAFDEFLAWYGLTHGRWITLVLLRRSASGTALPSELAEKQGVSKATMSGLLTGLADAGLVRRESTGDDGRCSAAVLTAAGQQLLDRTVPHYYEKVAQWMEPLSSAEQQQITEMLERMVHREGVSPAVGSPK